MALTNKKHERFYSTSGTNADKISSSKLAEVKDLWDKDVASGGNIDLLSHPNFGPLLYQIQQMQDELDYLRTEISANKDTDLVIVKLYITDGSNTYTLTEVTIPALVTLVLEDNLKFDSSVYDLKIDTSTTAEITVIIK